MKIIEVRDYEYTRMRETAVVTFKTGKLMRVRTKPIYRLRNDVWRFDGTDQPVKGIEEHAKDLD